MILCLVTALGRGGVAGRLLQSLWPLLQNLDLCDFSVAYTWGRFSVLLIQTDWPGWIGQLTVQASYYTVCSAISLNQSESSTKELHQRWIWPKLECNITCHSPEWLRTNICIISSTFVMLKTWKMLCRQQGQFNWPEYNISEMSVGWSNQLVALIELNWFWNTNRRHV